MRAAARSHANIALVKYWGKRDAALNLPVAGSLSLTLNELATETSVEFDPALAADTLELNGAPAPAPAVAKVSRFLDLVRARAALGTRARVVSRNDFPTASGLASSSSAFAALAVAATHAAGLAVPPPALSELARRGSGSAARSIYGGFVEMLPGTLPDGSDAVAVPVAPAEHWDVRIVVAATTLGAKLVSSTDGMETTTRTSPYFPAWVATQAADLAGVRAGVLARDLEKVGEIMEHNALKMHACAMAARPAVLYWNGRTVDAMHAVYALRREGVPAYFTIDGGPHVKVLCRAADAARVERALAAVPGVARTIVCAPGAGAALAPDALAVERA
jgi:diphosphomevalonate decarboxylase